MQRCFDRRRNSGRNQRSPVICRCHRGYLLNRDKSTCRDFDECSRNNGFCSDTCINAPGSFMCSCFGNGTRILTASGRRCVDVEIPDVEEEEEEKPTCAVNNGGCQQVLELSFFVLLNYNCFIARGNVQCENAPNVHYTVCILMSLLNCFLIYRSRILAAA